VVTEFVVVRQRRLSEAREGAGEASLDSFLARLARYRFGGFAGRDFRISPCRRVTFLAFTLAILTGAVFQSVGQPPWVWEAVWPSCSYIRTS
jgi:hypothetical protein